jgi:hypothetical protein
MCDVLEKQHVAADKTALEVRILGPTEDLGDFANSLRILTCRAYGYVYKPLQVEERAGEAFGHGLTGNLKQRVRGEFPENFDAALQLARNLEAVGVSRLNKVVAPVAPAVAGPTPAVGAVWAPHNPGGRGPSQGSKSSQRFGSGSQGSQGASQWARPKPDITCWYCNAHGHTKAECRKKAAANAVVKNVPSKNGQEPGSYRPPESQ